MPLLMCDLCQMQFDFDHEATARDNIPCPGCGRFYIDPEQSECYHCFAQRSGLEGCEQCELEGTGCGTAVN